MNRLISFCISLTFFTSSCTLYLPSRALKKNEKNNEKGITYSHNTYMNRLITKTQVVSAFGVPTRKDYESGIEFYTYDYGNFEGKRYFAEFQFDRSGKTLRWKSNGLDKGNEKHDPVAGAILGVLIDACLILLAITE